MWCTGLTKKYPPWIEFLAYEIRLRRRLLKVLWTDLQMTKCWGELELINTIEVRKIADLRHISRSSKYSLLMVIIHIVIEGHLDAGTLQTPGIGKAFRLLKGSSDWLKRSNVLQSDHGSPGMSRKEENFIKRDAPSLDFIQFNNTSLF